MTSLLPTSWVVFRLSALGDVVLVTGVLDYWSRQYGWKFTIVTRKAWSPVFEGHPAVDAVISLEDADLAFPRVGRVFSEIASQHSGKGLLDLHGTLRSRLLSMLWRGPVRRYRKLSLERRVFLKSRGTCFGESLRRWNVPQRYALATESEAPERRALVPHIYLAPEELAQGRAMLASLGDGPLVALHPYSTHPDKAWLPERWQALAEQLDAAGIGWFVVGRGAKILEAGRGIDFTGRTSLRETCALLAAAATLVTGDSGPMHLAGAVGTPVVALFGPTTREWGFYPEGARDAIVESAQNCRPCSLHGSKRCDRQGACMADIMPEAVLESVRRLLAD